MSSQPAVPTPAEVLRWCSAADPEPWYPSVHIRDTGTPRDRLDGPLDELRLAGYLELTDWVQGRGQGYRLTPAGRDAARRGKVTLKAAPAVTPRDPDAPPRRPVSPWERGEIVRAAMLAGGRAYVTWALVAANLIVFAAGMILARQQGHDANAVLRGALPSIPHLLGAVTGADLARGEWWRLLACCFVHHDAGHLAMNMFSLIMIGPLVERLWGHGRYLALYLIAGIGGAVAGVYPDPNVLLAGASGAIWGLLVSILAWLLLNRSHLPYDMLVSWASTIGLVLVINTAQSFQGHVSWQGHFGGGATGALAAVLLNLERFGSHTARWVSVALLAAMPPAALGILADHMHRNLRWNALVEKQLFEQDTRRVVSEAGAAAEAVYSDETGQLLRENPADRDAAAVARARGEIAAARQGLRDAAARLGEQHYRSEELDKGRKLGLNRVVELDRLLGMLDERLAAKTPWTLEQMEAYRQQMRHTNGATRDWNDRPASR
jgi:membrane associated rhomboid family serine protease